MIIIRNGTKKVSLQTLFGGLNYAGIAVQSSTLNNQTEFPWQSVHVDSPLNHQIVRDLGTLSLYLQLVSNLFCSKEC